MNRKVKAFAHCEVPMIVAAAPKAIKVKAFYDDKTLIMSNALPQTISPISGNTLVEASAETTELSVKEVNELATVATCPHCHSVLKATADLVNSLKGDRIHCVICGEEVDVDDVDEAENSDEELEEIESSDEMEENDSEPEIEEKIEEVQSSDDEESEEPEVDEMEEKVEVESSDDEEEPEVELEDVEIEESDADEDDDDIEIDEELETEESSDDEDEEPTEDLEVEEVESDVDDSEELDEPAKEEVIENESSDDEPETKVEEEIKKVEEEKPAEENASDDEEEIVETESNSDEEEKKPETETTDEVDATDENESEESDDEEELDDLEEEASVKSKRISYNFMKDAKVEANSIDIVANKDHTTYYVMCSSKPIATMSKDKASSEIASIFNNEANMRVALNAALENGFTKEVRASFGITPIVLSFRPSKAMRAEIANTKAKLSKQFANAKKDYAERLCQSLSIAAVGVNKGIYGANTLKNSIAREATLAGMIDAEDVVNDLFAKYGEDYIKAIIEKAKELVEKSDEVRNETASFVETASFNRTISSEVAKRLSNHTPVESKVQDVVAGTQKESAYKRLF